MNSIITLGPINDSLSNNNLRKSYSEIAVLVDENTKKHCLPMVIDILNTDNIIEIRSGEENKTLERCQQIWQYLTDWAFDRSSLLINLGGGVIGDMGGFCAATYKRGIDFINIPTTLLSMVDASVGGKLGIDFGKFKNHIGIFQPPEAVFVDPNFLSTLPDNELRSGYAEVIKHALIQDEPKWRELAANEYNSSDWKSIIEYSIAIKNSIVEQDPKEKGLRKILNFGHTIGHAIESHFLDKPNKLLHGEAIAIGMICEAYLSKDQLEFPEEDFHSIQSHITKTFGKVEIDADDIESITDLLIQDKKNKSGAIQAVLLKKIGAPKFDMPITTIETKRSLEYYVKLDV